MRHGLGRRHGFARRHGLPASLAAVLVVSGCSHAPVAEVIAADGALCDITRRLAADDLRVSCLLGANDDPHQLQLSPVQSRQIRQARLVLINGYGLTPALDRLSGAVRVAEEAVPGSPVLDDETKASSSAALQPAPGHLHGDRDPHVWHDPYQAAALVDAVSGRLQVLDPEASSRIQARTKAMKASLTALHRWNNRQFATVAEPRLLASGHRAFASLARAYNLNELATLDEDSASNSLRPRALASVIQQLQERRPGALFSERMPPSRALERISQLSGIPIAPQPLRADSGGDNLMVTLTDNTCLIVNQLGGRCDLEGQTSLLELWARIR